MEGLLSTGPTPSSLPINLVQMKLLLSLLQKLIRLAASDEGNGEAGAGERKV